MEGDKGDCFAGGGGGGPDGTSAYILGEIECSEC
jgi:hypothetical protein